MKFSMARWSRQLGLVLGLISIVVACQTSPKGRKQLILVPESQLTTMGAQAFDEMKAKQPIERDPRINAYVRCISDAITSVLPEKGSWEVVVFRDDSANAFALPGGKIGVHTGLLKVAENQSQLAAVIGHEVGHVLARHGNERVSEGLVAQGGLAALSIAMSEKGKNYQLLMAGLGLGAQFGILLPHGRAQESEADLIGLDLMAKAGFDPQQSVELWKNMAKAGGGQPPEFLSTHPSHGTRTENLTNNMPQAMQLYRASGRQANCVR